MPEIYTVVPAGFQIMFVKCGCLVRWYVCRLHRESSCSLPMMPISCHFQCCRPKTLPSYESE